MQRTKVCPICGKNFSYEIGKGNDRIYCKSADCQLARKRLRLQERLIKMPKCQNDGCHNPADRVGAGLCDKCYCRLRRTGTLGERIPRYKYTTYAGYIKLLKPNHPLADSNGNVFEHRYIIYEHMKGRDLNCFWCGGELTWEDAVVDHLNEIKADNNISNLVVSCNNCNRSRGAMVPFIKRLKEGSLPTLISCIEAIRI